MDFISVCNNWFEFGLYLTRFPHYREMSWRHWYLQHLWVGSVEEEHCLYWLHLTRMLSCVFWSWVNLARAPLAMLPDITSTGSFLFLLTAKKQKITCLFYCSCFIACFCCRFADSIRGMLKLIAVLMMAGASLAATWFTLTCLTGLTHLPSTQGSLEICNK